MADLLKYVNGSLTTGLDVDVYMNHSPKIGTGRALIVETLHLKLTGEIDLPFIGKLRGDVEIAMPDTSDSGQCSMTFNGRKATCQYRTDRGYLYVEFPGAEVTLNGGASLWSWVGVSKIPGWIGVWPQGRDLADDDFVTPDAE